MALQQILKSVREQRHFSIASVSKWTKIAEASLSAIEDGQREPSYNQLEKLAAAYGVAPYLFVSEAAPNLPQVLPDFRNMEPAPARLSPSGMRRIWAVESRAHFSWQLSVATKYEAPKLTPKGVAPRGTPGYAAILRDTFDEWLAKRINRFEFAGSEEQQFLSGMRIFLEVQGILVNFDAAPPEDFTGFYVDPDGGVPSIFVNRAIYSKKAQLFTLAHEYCHHILGASGVSDPFVSRNAIERACNKFAAEFLAPEADFRKMVEGFSPEVRRAPDSLIRRASNQTMLSKHAAAIRLVECGFLTDEALQAWRAERFPSPAMEKAEDEEARGGAPHAKRVGEVGYLSTYLAASAVSRKFVDKYDVKSGISLAESLQPAAFDLASRRFDLAMP